MQRFQTIYNVLKAARVNILKPQNSTNNRFKQARYGIKRLTKVEKAIQDKLKKRWCPEKCAGLKVFGIVNINKANIKHFYVVKHLFRKTTTPTNCSA